MKAEPSPESGHFEPASNQPESLDRVVESSPEPESGGRPSGGKLASILRTLRPHQWVKNVFVLAPVVFAKEIFEVDFLLRATGAFFVFCFLSGAVYTINDIADVEVDRLHPVKRHRPIASGAISVAGARLLAGTLVVGSLLAAASIALPFLLVVLGYFTLNVAYSLKLKHVAYVDVACIALGFVLRVVGGGVATEIAVSWYLLLCTALLALFLGFGKRRHELTAAAGRARLQRAALESYTKRGLDVALATTAVATLVTYVIYTLDPHTREFFGTDWLWPSALFVVLGELRFITLVRTRPKSESPTQEMLKDGPFVLIVLLWVMLVMWLVYNLRPS